MQHTGGRKKGGLGFSKTSIETAIDYLMENCYFNAGYVTMKQVIVVESFAT